MKKAIQWIVFTLPTPGVRCYSVLRYHVEIPTKRQLYISSNWLVEVVWSRQLFIKYNSTLLISETVQIFNNNFVKWKTRRLLLFNLYGKTFFWQYNSLLALLWGECPIIYTQRLMRLDLQYSHIFTVFMIDFMIDFDKYYSLFLVSTLQLFAMIKHYCYWFKEWMILKFFDIHIWTRLLTLNQTSFS